ncbi:DUF4189 domain-containing protein [Stenotrophomonas sp.]|uniref:DUF4189 domain-containing protein n=1 Tax=Stenotrophomonas sp. TaxID=69392 RepID=UPI00289DD5BC|nr:DUF4189 domain-containing protein [Stenotrophomonas sp.]
MRVFLLLALLVFPVMSQAEGRCPPGQFPVGGQGMVGCAPIPGGGTGEAPSPVATGKWETRWGAIAEDFSANARGVPLVTGVAESRKSKREAGKIAVQQCEQGGGQECKVVATYYNQCIAVADPKPRSQGGPGGKSVIYNALTAELAQKKALDECNTSDAMQCSIIYSACSMSEFKKF